MQKKNKDIQMGLLEPAIMMAKKLQHGVEEETNFLLIKNDKQKPFIQQFTAELQAVDAEYIKVHSVQDAFDKDK